MLRSLAHVIVRRRRTVLVAAVAFFAAAGVFGSSVISHLTTGGFEDPGSESSRATAIIESTFGAGTPNLVLLVTAASGDVDDPAAVAAGLAVTGELAAEEGVTQVVSYWSLGGAPPLRSQPGDQALVLGTIAGDDDEVAERIKLISPHYTRRDDVVTVQVGGVAEIFRAVTTQVESDLQRAEIISLPVTLLLLVLVFGSVVAAGLPLAIGLVSVVGTFLALRVLTMVTDVSIFSINLTTALGLGLAIDYSLFIVSRYREELRAGREPGDAVVRTVETAGRTVVFSALTVAISLSALLVFPLVFLRSFAYAGVAVVLLAGIASVVALPALLAVVGRRIDRLTLWRRTPKPVGEGFWHGMAMAVMRRPVAIGGAVVAFLLVLGIPFLGISFSVPDHRVLPAGNQARQVAETIQANFAAEADAAVVVAAGIGDPHARTVDIAAYAAALSRLDGVARVDAITGSYIAGLEVVGPTEVSRRFAAPDATWLSVVPAVEPISPEGERMVQRIRDTPAPFPVAVGGRSAELVDSRASLFGRLPLAGGIILVVTFVLLFLMSGGLLVPVKAIVLNLLSLTATFGAMVWVFQDGHLSGLLGFTATGSIELAMPILMFCIAFGLSMDYEVFLLSRIKEEYDRTGDNTAAVAIGLERTGRIVTAAAAIVAVIFIAFATSGITFIKMFGVGLALAVIMDASLVRATLVPAFMRLAGDANWWAPRPLRWVHQRVGLREAPAADPVLAMVEDGAA